MIREVAKVILVHPEQEKFLTLRLSAEEREARGIDEWHVPGGSREPEDKRLEDTAIREVFEETGFRVEIVRELGQAAWSAFYEGQPADFEATFFEAHLVEGQDPDGINLQTEEASDCAWIGIDQFEDYPGLTPEAKDFSRIAFDK